jgi:signal peptidase I
MMPGLHPGDVLLVDKRAYQAAAPQRGDLVLARDGAGLIIKRVVGLPGEEVEVRWGELLVNGAPLAEPHAASGGWLNLGKGRLLAERYALLGDNRADPGSASVHAVVAKDQIVGKVVCALRLRPGWRHPDFSEVT